MCFIWLLFSLSDFFRHLRKCWRRCCRLLQRCGVGCCDVCKKCVAMINFTFHLLLIRRFLSQQKPALLIIRLLNGTFTLAPTFSPILQSSPLLGTALMLPLALAAGHGRRLENLKTCELDAYLHHHCNIIMHLTSTKCSLLQLCPILYLSIFL